MDSEKNITEVHFLSQQTNDRPKIMLEDLQSHRVFEFGKNCHDELVISEDGRCLYYENTQCGDGSQYGEFRFFYEKPKIVTKEDMAHATEIDYWARSVEKIPIDEVDK